jgi:hypothetical protein
MRAHHPSLTNILLLMLAILYIQQAMNILYIEVASRKNIVSLAAAVRLMQLQNLTIFVWQHKRAPP